MTGAAARAARTSVESSESRPILPKRALLTPGGDENGHRDTAPRQLRCGYLTASLASFSPHKTCNGVHPGDNPLLYLLPPRSPPTRTFTVIAVLRLCEVAFLEGAAKRGHGAAKRGHGLTLDWVAGQSTTQSEGGHGVRAGCPKGGFGRTPGSAQTLVTLRGHRRIIQNQRKPAEASSTHAGR